MRRVLIVVGALALTGCASIVSKSDWPVCFTAATPTDFQVRDENGLVRCAGRTPTTVVLSASDGYFDGMTYTVESAVGTRELSARLNGWYVGNVVFGGLLGLLIVDPATGAMWRLPETLDLVAPPARVAPASE